MSRVGVIVHERLGNWARQLRPRLAAQHARMRETRSWPDLEAAIMGLAAPVAVFDLHRLGPVGLVHLDRLMERAGDAWVLVLDPTGDHARGRIARELGATHVITGAAPPSDVAALIGRWVVLAEQRIERGGWHRPLDADPRLEPWAWLAEYGIETTARETTVAPPRAPRLIAPSTADPSQPRAPGSRPANAV